MRSKQQKLKIEELMNDVQIATLGGFDITDDNYIVKVKNRIKEVEEAIKVLKKEIVKQDLDNSE